MDFRCEAPTTSLRQFGRSRLERQLCSEWNIDAHGSYSRNQPQPADCRGYLIDDPTHL